MSPFSVVPVALKDRSYNILVGDNLLIEAGLHIKSVLRNNRVAIITDETVAELHLSSLQESLKSQNIDYVTIVLPPGESTKNLENYKKVLEQLLQAKIQRDEALIALGGGVIGDMTGFAAATLRRGVDFIQVPTTLLSQVDSSVGGKTGINTPQGKNLIGAFYQPKLVIADVGILGTLPKRQILAGYAEVVKYGLLGDFDFFSWLEVNGEKVINGDIPSLIHAVVESVRAKAKIVAEDEREGGVRALLNLGHTFGHALEAETGYGPNLNHGEAVSLGTILAAELSGKTGHLEQQDCTRIRAHFSRIGLPVSFPNIPGLDWNAEKLVEHMRQDKKITGGKLTLILMNAIGSAFATQNVSENDIVSILAKEIDRKK